METDEFIVEQEGDHIRVEVPMPLPYEPTPSFVTSDLVGALILIPIWVVCYDVYKRIYNPPIPARAQFLIDPENVTMNLCHPEAGQKVSHKWPSPKVVELRKNQYHNGLHIRIEGILMETFLNDLSDERIDELSEILRESIRKVVSDSKL